MRIATVQPDTERPSLAGKLAIAFLLLAAVALIAIGGSAATFSEVDGWYARAQKAPWSPPNWVFGPVWSVLYLIIALSGWLVWRAGFRAQRKNAATGLLALYAAQLVLNGLWTPVFFAGYPVAGPAAWWAAFVIILTLIITVIWFGLGAVAWSRIAAFLMVPYLAWLLFAASLNLAIPLLN